MSIDLDNLTLGQIKQLKTLLLDGVEKPKHHLIGKKVIIRTYSAGVHYGTLLSVDGEQVVLGDAIRIWRWAGAFTLSELATNGPAKPSECKFSAPAKTITLTMIEIIECSFDGSNKIEKVAPYEP